MRPLPDAQRAVLAAMRPLPAVAMDLDEARGLALAEDVIAADPVPPFDNSAMDGFAVRSSDVTVPGAELTVIEDVPAGRVASRAVDPGTAIRIMTGAPLPAGADTIVIVEDSTMIGPDRVRLGVAAPTGQHVRSAGGDVAAGTVVLAGGTRLGAADIGVLASVGVDRPIVRRRPTVAIASTGDELMAAGSSRLRPGSIRDSNRPMLRAMLEDLGVSVLDLGIVPDDERLLRAALEEAAAAADAVVTSGGVSMGDYDVVKRVLGSLGHVEFWKVAMQPAKPFAFGFLGDTPMFGLPGNPVSVAVAFEQFVRPALLHRMGATRVFRRRSWARADENFSTPPEKVAFLRVRVDADERGQVVRSAGGQGSNVLSGLARADAFAIVPVGTGDVSEGESVEVEWFRSPETRTMQEVLGG